MNKNWFGLEPHETDSFILTGHTQKEMLEDAKEFRRLWDEIATKAPDLVPNLKRLIRAAMDEGFSDGYEIGYSSGCDDCY